jgi:hypothetical protein
MNSPVKRTPPRIAVATLLLNSKFEIRMNVQRTNAQMLKTDAQSQRFVSSFVI